MQRRHVLAFALAATIVALPASSQQGKERRRPTCTSTSTHNMAGMPDMGGMMGGWAASWPGAWAAMPANRRIPTTRGRHDRAIPGHRPAQQPEARRRGAGTSCPPA